MKIQSIPAQITTVEDKIVGNLSLTQIVLLMLPMFWLMIVYTLFTPSMQFVLYKLPLFLLVASMFLVLALRIKDKIVLHWLVILLRFHLRPTYYVFDKNDPYLRTMEGMDSGIKKKRITPTSSKARALQTPVTIGDLVRLDGLLTNPHSSFSIKSKKKGTVYVAFEQNKP